MCKRFQLWAHEPSVKWVPVNIPLWACNGPESNRIWCWQHHLDSGSVSVLFWHVCMGSVTEHCIILITNQILNSILVFTIFITEIYLMFIYFWIWLSYIFDADSSFSSWCINFDWGNRLALFCFKVNWILPQIILSCQKQTQISQFWYIAVFQLKV